MSGFPLPLQIGQGLTPNELDLDEPGESDQFKRFRDRDEYLKSIISDGPLAPEDLDVLAISVQGVPLALPEVHFRSGLSVANGSYTINADFFAWISGVWANVIVLPFTLTQTKIGMVSTSFAYTKSYAFGAGALFRLVVDGVEVGRVDLTNDWSQGAAADSWSGGLSFAGDFIAGSHWVAVQFLQPWSIGYFGRAAFQTVFMPNLSVLIT